VTPARGRRPHASPRDDGSTLRAVSVVLAALVMMVAASVGAGSGRSPVAAVSPASDGMGSSGVAPSDALSSVWYCPGAGSAPISGTSLVVADGGSQALRALIEPGLSTAANKQPATRLVTVQAGSTSEIDLSPLVPGGVNTKAGPVAATVEMNRGAGAVYQSVEAGGRQMALPCDSALSAGWYFPTGSTAAGSSEWITLFNPQLSPAVADLSFVVGSGTVSPSEFQGLVVPPGRVVSEPLNVYVAQQSTIATTVTAVSGLLVATESVLSSKTGLELLPGYSGLSRQLVLPAPATTGRATVVLFNPGNKATAVSVATGSGELSHQLLVNAESIVTFSIPPLTKAPIWISSGHRPPLVGVLTWSGLPMGEVGQSAESPTWLVVGQAPTIDGFNPGPGLLHIQAGAGGFTGATHSVAKGASGPVLSGSNGSGKGSNGSGKEMAAQNRATLIRLTHPAFLTSGSSSPTEYTPLPAA
jgi:hypothetical protein